MMYLINKIKHRFVSCVNILYGGALMLMTSSMFKSAIIIKARDFQTSTFNLSKKHPEIGKIVSKLNKHDQLKIHLTKGYLGYTNEFKLLGIVLDDKDSFIQAIRPFLDSLNPNKIYHVLPVLNAQMVSDTQNFIITKHAIKIHKDMDIAA